MLNTCQSNPTSSVSVLDGGLPAWEARGFPIDTEAEELETVETAGKVAQNPPDAPTYTCSLNTDWVADIHDVMDNIASQKYVHIDARPEGRFLGKVPEPRAGVRGGHVPGSFCTPQSSFVGPDGLLKSESEMKQILQKVFQNPDKPVIASCGTGVTACLPALALYMCTDQQVKVYDGSWTEWGSKEDTPIAT